MAASFPGTVGSRKEFQCQQDHPAVLLSDTTEEDSVNSPAIPSLELKGKSGPVSEQINEHLHTTTNLLGNFAVQCKLFSGPDNKLDTQKVSTNASDPLVADSSWEELSKCLIENLCETPDESNQIDDGTDVVGMVG